MVRLSHVQGVAVSGTNMKHWNYRVLEFFDEETHERWRAIHVVYYDDQGMPIHYDEHPAAVSSEDLESVNGLKAELWSFSAALNKSVLLGSEFPTIGSEYSVEGDAR